MRCAGRAAPLRRLDSACAAGAALCIPRPHELQGRYNGAALLDPPVLGLPLMFLLFSFISAPRGHI